MIAFRCDTCCHKFKNMSIKKSFKQWAMKVHLANGSVIYGVYHQLTCTELLCATNRFSAMVEWGQITAGVCVQVTRGESKMTSKSTYGVPFVSNNVPK